TVTPGSTAPDESRTTPAIDWAAAIDGIITAGTMARTRRLAALAPTGNPSIHVSFGSGWIRPFTNSGASYGADGKSQGICCSTAAGCREPADTIDFLTLCGGTTPAI